MIYRPGRHDGCVIAHAVVTVALPRVAYGEPPAEIHTYAGRRYCRHSVRHSSFEFETCETVLVGDAGRHIGFVLPACEHAHPLHRSAGGEIGHGHNLFICSGHRHRHYRRGNNNIIMIGRSLIVHFAIDHRTQRVPAGILHHSLGIEALEPLSFGIEGESLQGFHSTEFDTARLHRGFAVELVQPCLGFGGIPGIHAYFKRFARAYERRCTHRHRRPAQARQLIAQPVVIPISGEAFERLFHESGQELIVGIIVGFFFILIVVFIQIVFRIVCRNPRRTHQQSFKGHACILIGFVSGIEFIQFLCIMIQCFNRPIIIRGRAGCGGIAHACYNPIGFLIEIR